MPDPAAVVGSNEEKRRAFRDAWRVLSRRITLFASLPFASLSKLALQEHLDRTGSPRAARLLSRRGTLPLLRVQPIHLQGTIESTWQPVLAKLNSSLAVPVEAQHAAASHAVSV